MAGTPHSVDKVLDVFGEFNGRRSGILRALTTDYIEFYELCNPAKDAQCLVGLPNGSWEIKPPEMMDPRDLAEPVSGINFWRFWMPEQEWAALVTAHCDSWLLGGAYNAGGRSGFTESEREMLFEKINELPTVCETVQESSKCNDQSGATMLKKPESSLAVSMSSPQKDESGAAIQDGHTDGSSSYGQNKSSGTYANNSRDDSWAQKDESSAAIEDGHNEGSSSYGQIKSSGTQVNSSDDDSEDSVCLRKH